MTYSLIVIDMQPHFIAAGFPKTLKNVKAEVKKAVDSNAHIFFVEYDMAGCTNPDIVKLTKGYDKVFFVTKKEDDGSREIKKAIWKHKAPDRKIKICGVNTDCCVFRTVAGLEWMFSSSRIEILAHACNSELDHHGAIQEMQRDLDVVIVGYNN